MGNQFETQERQFSDDLEGFIFQSELGNSRFLKTFKMYKENFGLVIVKSYPKIKEIDFSKYEEDLLRIRSLLIDVPFRNILPYEEFITTPKTVYLVRHYFSSNLFDRMSTRPFLTDIEKRWITFQMLMGVHQAHSRGVFHGDIKIENIFLTSSLWVFILDPSPFKPTKLPIKNPSIFSYFFDSSRRKACYTAPERFVDDDDDDGNILNSSNNQLTQEMDIFSLGCVIGELFLETEPLFFLSDLLMYKKGKFQAQNINLIQNEKVREMIQSMIQIDPSQRLSAQEYLKKYREVFFPNNFYDHLHEFFGANLIKSSDQKIEEIYHNLPQIFKQLEIKGETKLEFEAGIDEIETNYSKSSEIEREINTNNQNQNQNQNQKKETQNFQLLNNQKMIEKIENLKEHLQNFEKDLNSIDKDKDKYRNKNKNKNKNKDKNNDKDKYKENEEYQQIFEVHYSESETKRDKKQLQKQLSKEHEAKLEKARKIWKKKPKYQLLILLINEICSSLKTIKDPNTKLKALKLILNFSSNVDDKMRFDKIIPYVFSLISDKNGIVRAKSIETITLILEMVNSVSAFDYLLFPEYLLPNLLETLKDHDLIVRLTFVKYIPRLAFIGKNFIFLSLLQQQQQKQQEQEDLNQITNEKAIEKKSNETKNDLQVKEEKQNQSKKELNKEFSEKFEKEYQHLQQNFEIIITYLFEDKNPSIRRQLLAIMKDICMFFGENIRNNKILILLITFLNDKDWQLKTTLMDKTIELVPFFGTKKMNYHIIPCIMESIFDIEEVVIQKALETCAKLAEINEILKENMIEIMKKVAPLLLHPNLWIKYSTIRYFTAVFEKMDIVDAYCFIFPVLKPFLKYQISDINEVVLLDCLEDSIPREIYEELIQETYLTKQNNLNELEFEQRLRKAVINLDSQNSSKKLSLQMKLNNNSNNDSSFLENLNMKRRISIYPPEMTWKILKLKQFIIKASSNPKIEVEIKRKIKDMKEKENKTENPKIRILENGEFFQMKIPEKIQLKSKKVDSVTSNLSQYKISTTKIAKTESQLNPYSKDFKDSQKSQLAKKKSKIKGINIATNTEHKSNVSRIAISSDQSLLASYSTDGTVKLFNIGTFFKKQHLISQQTLSTKTGKITSMEFFDNLKMIALGYDRGTISFYPIDYDYGLDFDPKRNPISEKSIKNISTNSQSAIIDIKNIYNKTEYSKEILYATQRGDVHRVDLRAHDYSLDFNPFGKDTDLKFSISGKYGLLTSLMVEPEGNWVSIGTDRGYVLSYDLRFLFPFQILKYSNSKIMDIQYFHDPKNPFNIAISSEKNKITILDISNSKANHDFRITKLVSQANETQTPTHFTLPRAIKEKISSLFPNQEKNTLSFLEYSQLNSELDQQSNENLISNKFLKPQTQMDKQDLEKIEEAIEFLDSGKIPKEEEKFRKIICSYQNEFMISGGVDQSILYWDLKKFSNSYVISGKSKKYQNFVFFSLFPNSEKKDYSIVHLNQNQAKNSHQDSISDLKLFDIDSNNYLISSSRDGVIKIWK